jgi:hypothetical protein
VRCLGRPALFRIEAFEDALALHPGQRSGGAGRPS